jgi:hypothetical protein
MSLYIISYIGRHMRDDVYIQAISTSICPFSFPLSVNFIYVQINGGICFNIYDSVVPLPNLLYK